MNNRQKEMQAKIAKYSRLAKAAIARGDVKLAKKHLKTLKRLGDICRYEAMWAGSAFASTMRDYESGNVKEVVCG